MALQFKNLISLEKDMASKWRVQIDITDEIIMLKFQSQPTLQNVKDEVKKYIENRIAMKVTEKVAELEIINSEISRLQTRKTELESAIK